MKIKRKTIFRAKGKLFCVVELNHESDIYSICAKAVSGNAIYPAQVYPFQKDGETNDGIHMDSKFVITIPFLDIPSVDVLIEAKADADSRQLEHPQHAAKAIRENIHLKFSVNFKRAKFESALNYRIKKELVNAAKCCDESIDTNSYQVRLLRFLEGENHKAIWRFDVTWKGDPKEVPEIAVFDSSAKSVEHKLYLFEHQEISKTFEANRLIYSLEIPYDLNYFYVEATSPNKKISGFASCEGAFYNIKRAETANFMKDACADESAYRKWLANHQAKDASLAAQRKIVFDMPCKFSIIVPSYKPNAEFMMECLASVTAQSYEDWELILIDSSANTGIAKRCVDHFEDKRIRYFDIGENRGIVGNTNFGIEQAVGDWICFLDYDDIIEPDTLFCYAKAIFENDDKDALFCDEDTFEEKGSYSYPIFKSDLNLDLLYSYNCVTHFLAVSRAKLEEIGLSLPDVTGAQDYDLTLRILGSGGKIHHVPRILYHWREHSESTSRDNANSKPYAQEAGKLALTRHFANLDIAGVVEDTDRAFVYRMRYAVQVPHKLVSIIIPNKDHISELDTCVTSIIEKSKYREFEIIIVENNSEEAATFEYYDEICSKYSQVKVVKYAGEFNYSAIINYGVSNSSGEYLLLLNNDTKVISDDFLEEMIGYAQRPEVGVVGAKLFFRDGLVQHAGIEIGPFDQIVHVNQDFTDVREGYRGRACRPGNFSAVTGACQLVRRDVFNQVDGYDIVFAVGFNDADFCLRVKDAGYLTTFTPYAKLFHYEFTSRGRETANSAKLKRWEKERDLFHKRWKKYFIEGDPFSNPNLSLNSSYYALPD